MNHPFVFPTDGGVLLTEVGSLLLSSNARAVALLLLCFYLLRTLGRTASFRHLLVASVLTGMLFLPWFSVLIPAVDVIVEVAHTEFVAGPNAEAGRTGLPALVAEGWQLSDLVTCAILVYGLGILFHFLKQAWSIVLIAGVTWAAKPVRELHWQEGLGRAQTTFGIRRPIGMRYSRAITSPVTWGFLQPVILLPPGASNWPTQMINSTLLHETAHVRRCDWFTQQIARLACALYWINPLCWRALRRLEDNAESACDDLVLSAGIKGTSYAGDLIQVAKHICGHNQVASAALAMSISREPSQLANRVNAILSPAADRRFNSRSQAVVTLALILFVLSPLASLRTNYVEVPVFAPSSLTRITTATSADRLNQTEVSAPASRPSTGAEPAFNREALKQVAVTELRSTIAKINASTREWLGDTEPTSKKPVLDENPESGRDTEPQVASGSSAVPKGINDDGNSSVASEPPIGIEDNATGSAEALTTADSPNHPLVAWLRKTASQRPSDEASRYTHTRIVKPDYPRRALDRGIEGEVVVSFDIDRHGRVVHPKIINAVPAGVFDRQVLRAVEQFEFTPTMVDGSPVEVRGAREVFKFVLKS